MKYSYKFEILVIKILVAICRYLTKDDVAMPKYMIDVIGNGEQFINKQKKEQKPSNDADEDTRRHWHHYDRDG